MQIMQTPGTANHLDVSNVRGIGTRQLLEMTLTACAQLGVLFIPPQDCRAAVG